MMQTYQHTSTIGVVTALRFQKYKLAQPSTLIPREWSKNLKSAVQAAHPVSLI
jgi:hypothetical protein